MWKPHPYIRLSDTFLPLLLPSIAVSLVILAPLKCTADVVWLRPASMFSQQTKSWSKPASLAGQSPALIGPVQYTIENDPHRAVPQAPLLGDRGRELIRMVRTEPVTADQLTRADAAWHFKVCQAAKEGDMRLLRSLLRPAPPASTKLLQILCPKYQMPPLTCAVVHGHLAAGKS